MLLYFVLYFIRSDLGVPSFPTRRSSDLGRRDAQCARGFLDTKPHVSRVHCRKFGGDLSLDFHPAPPEFAERAPDPAGELRDRKSTRLNSSHLGISYAVFCLKKKIEIFFN